MTGAVTGFSVGFLLDCLLIAPLGGASLVLLAVGYLAGAVPRALRDPQPPGGAAALLRPHPVRRARLRRRRAMLGHRHLGQPAGRSATCWSRASSPSSSAGRSTSACAAPLRPALVEEPAVRRRRGGRRCWEPRRRVPALRRPPATQPHGAADRRRSAASPWRSSRSSSSGSGTCRCSTAPSTWPRRRTTAPANTGSRPARRDPRPQRRGPGRQPDQPGAAVEHRRSCPRTRPKNGRADADRRTSPTCR